MSTYNIQDFSGQFRNSSRGKDHRHDLLNDIDSDVNILFDENAVTERTNYVTIRQFNDIQINVKSFINANIRSMVKNLHAFKTFLISLNHSFTFIACTEN